MKITITILFVAIFSATATTYSQENSINLKMKNTSVKDVFTEIERTTDYIFLFSGNLGNEINKKINVAIHSESLDEALKIITNDIGLKYEIADKQVIIYKGNYC